MSERKPIPGYENYEVSDDGRVFRLKPGPGAVVGRELKPCTDKNGYKKVCIGRQHKGYVHRLVALAFIPNHNCLPQVNHRDGNPANNNVLNLEWCDNSHNQRHAQYSLGRDNKGYEKRRIIGTHLASGMMIWMPSTSEAARFIRGDQSSISATCQGKYHHHKGWTFRDAE